MHRSLIERVLVVGHGSIGKRHLQVARETLPNTKIAVLRHQQTTVIPAFADYVLTSMTEAIPFSPQVAIIASPAPFHIETARELAPLGCHLLIEKPLSADSRSVQCLIEQVQAADIVCQVGYNLRFLASLREFRKLVHAGAVGKPLLVRSEIGQYLPEWRPGTDYRRAVSARSELGGGALLELSHEIDYLRWIFGEVAWVSAWLGKVSALEIDVEDAAYVTMAFKSPSREQGVTASLCMDFVRRDKTRACTVIGSEGSLRWNGFTGTIEAMLAGGEVWTQIVQHQAGRDDSYRAQWEHFLACIETRATPLISAADGLAVIQIIEAARSSATAGCTQTHVGASTDGRQ